MYGKVLILRPRIIVETCNPLLGSETGAMLQRYGPFFGQNQKGHGSSHKNANGSQWKPMEANGSQWKPMEPLNPNEL